MKILKYKQYQLIKEDAGSMFAQFGANPLGPGYGFAVDPSISVFSNQDSPYTGQYYKTPHMIQKVVDIMRNVYQDTDYTRHKFDHFLDDIDNFTDLKILRINVNQNLGVDVFISFMFNEDEFFSVYKNFNGQQKSTLTCDLFGNRRYNYIDHEYALKLDNYLFKLITNWFKPGKGFYTVLKDKFQIKNDMGEQFFLKPGQKIKVLGSNIDKDRMPFITVEYNEMMFYVTANNYYFFNYWCEKDQDVKLKKENMTNELFGGSTKDGDEKAKFVIREIENKNLPIFHDGLNKYIIDVKGVIYEFNITKLKSHTMKVNGESIGISRETYNEIVKLSGTHSPTDIRRVSKFKDFR